MPAKSADRKKESKEAKAAYNELAENLAAFVLPDSLPCSEVNFPVLVKRKAKANWNTILEESDKQFQEIKDYEDRKIEQQPKSPFLSMTQLIIEEIYIDTILKSQRACLSEWIERTNSACYLQQPRYVIIPETETEYIENEVFIHLLPALEETLNKAKIWNAFENHKCFFNGIDYIVQLLWNNNPRHPYRQDMNLHLYNMPWVRSYLAEHPRPLYPKSWLWTEDYAATLIQKTLRQYFVQKEEEVQEMRDFWRKLEVERDVPDIDVNPMLAKRFASQRNVHKNPNRAEQGPSSY